MEPVINHLFLCCALLLCVCETPKEQTVYSVHALPLGAQYYGPPTRDDIVQFGVHLYLTSSAIDTVQTLVRAGKLEPADADDELRLRVLVVDTSASKEFYITNNKRALVPHGASYQRVSARLSLLEQVLADIDLNIAESGKGTE